MTHAAAFGGRSGQLMLTLAAVLVLQACDGKESSFFAPAVDDGPGIVIPTPAELDGTWTVDYEVITTTCEASLSDYSVDAEMSTFSNGTVTLDVLVEESPVPIRGTYDTETGVFTGETGPVSVGGGELSNETWDVRFLTNSRDVQTFSGTSVEDFSSGGATVCERRFDISGSKLVAVPT
jgi:hypothetical protein